MKFAKVFLSIPFWLTISIWTVHILKTLLNLSLGWAGTHPRHFDEWYTAFTGALIHGDWGHLINNTYPLIILGFFIHLVFGKRSWFIYAATYFLTGLLIFLFARSNVYHIGISGVVYSWAAFLAVAGILRKDRLALGIALAVAFLYGSFIWGVLPGREGISWDGHLYGAIAGGVLAYYLKGLNPIKKKLTKEDLGDEYEFEKYDYGDYGYLKGKKDDNGTSREFRELYDNS